MAPLGRNRPLLGEHDEAIRYREDVFLSLYLGDWSRREESPISASAEAALPSSGIFPIWWVLCVGTALGLWSHLSLRSMST